MEGVVHADGSSQISCSDGTRIPGCMVLDATGHARKLVEYDKPFNPGYQVTYPCSCISETECPLRAPCASRVAAPTRYYNLLSLLPLHFIDALWCACPGDCCGTGFFDSEICALPGIACVHLIRTVMVK